MPASSGASMHSNMHSLGNQIGTKMRTLAQHGQPVIQIDLDNSHGTHGKWVTSYSTMDTIEGTVSITANHDTRFEDIEIAFIGTSQVYVDRLTSTPTVSGRTEATHRFLTLKQPIEDADLPCPRRLAAHKKYTFTFTFTVPDQLLPRACPHRVSNDAVREAHLQVPPSMGDPETAGFGGALLDDLAPEMSKIIYGVKVRITQVRESDGSLSILADKTRKVRVKPAFEEQPPISFDPSNGEYRLRQDKTIKKGLFKGKLGTLSAQSAQPKALAIPGARTTCTTPITTRAKVLLRFDPADENNAPPRLGSLATKIKISTYYASAPRQTFPLRSSLGYDLTQGVYGETISLSSMCIASAQWKKHDAFENPTAESDIERRDSGISDCSTLSTNEAFNAGVLTGSKKYKGGYFYTAEIVVPISLPDNKNFLPTFHSCLISRVYSLSLQLSAQAPGVSDPSLHLKVPVQITTDGSEAGIANARARSAEAFVARETADIFTPRSVAPPTPMDASGPEELPPQYSALAPAARYAARVLIAV